MRKTLIKNLSLFISASEPKTESITGKIDLHSKPEQDRSSTNRLNSKNFQKTKSRSNKHSATITQVYILNFSPHKKESSTAELKQSIINCSSSSINPDNFKLGLKCAPTHPNFCGLSRDRFKVHGFYSRSAYAYPVLTIA